MQEFILVVNDTAIQRKLFRQLLGLQGFRVMTAESKEAALAVAGAVEEKPLLIVMDVHLGEMDGLELTRELRAHCWAEGIPILLVSSLYKHLTKTEETVKEEKADDGKASERMLAAFDDARRAGAATNGQSEK